MGNLKLRYNQIFLVALGALFIGSCTNESLSNEVILNRSAINLNYDARCTLASFSTSSVFFEELKSTSLSFNPNFDNRIYLHYSNGRLSQIQGGIMRPLPGSGGNNYWTNNLLTNVVYSSDTIAVNYSGFYLKKFVLVGNRIKKQITSYNPGVNYSDFVNYSPGLHEYQYNGNLISETKNGLVRRLFYLSQGNLVKVELFFRDANAEIVKKIEYLFSNYDQQPNLLRGKFFIHGCFFKAFSVNNYKKIEINHYNYVDNAYQLDQSQYALFNYNLPEDMFVQQCN